jgi:hypothetical protein
MRLTTDARIATLTAIPRHRVFVGPPTQVQPGPPEEHAGVSIRPGRPMYRICGEAMSLVAAAGRRITRRAVPDTTHDVRSLGWPRAAMAPVTGKAPIPRRLATVSHQMAWVGAHRRTEPVRRYMRKSSLRCVLMSELSFGSATDGTRSRAGRSPCLFDDLPGDRAAHRKSPRPHVRRPHANAVDGRFPQPVR